MVSLDDHMRLGESKKEKGRNNKKEKGIRGYRTHVLPHAMLTITPDYATSTKLKAGLLTHLCSSESLVARLDG